MRRRVLLVLIGAVLAAGCAASQPPPADADCERICQEMWNSCKASCMKAMDPTGNIIGSTASCERTCSTQHYVCDVSCLKARRASPK